MRVPQLFLDALADFVSIACNHPLLVSKDYKQDLDAIEPKAVQKGGDDKDVDPDDLVAAFGKMGVTRKCQVCMTE